MASRRVVITGLGIISPLGLDLEETWYGLRAGRSAIGPIQSVDGSNVGLKIHNGAQAAIEAGFEDLWVQGRGRVHPLTIPKTMANAGASHISMDLGLSGPVYT